MTYEITFEFGTVSNCDYIGRTVSGVCAVVKANGVEVFRSAAHTKRIGGKIEAQAWIAAQN